MGILRRVFLPGLVGLCVLSALLGTAVSGQPAPGGPDGAALYKDKCASCHGDLAQNELKGTSADAIQAAIAKTRQMKALSDMKPADVQAVSAALSAKPKAVATTMPSSAPAGPLDGAALYHAKCASCHGALARSDVRGSSASKIQRANERKREMRPLANMPAAEVQAVADALSRRSGATTTSAPASGPAAATTPRDARRGRERTRRESG